MTDYYIAKAGVVQGGQKYAEVAVAAPSAAVTHSDRVGGATYSWACVYNTPKDSFDSIKMREVRNTTGHITTLSVYSMGAIPDDQNTSEDDSETDRVLRTDLLVASATHTQVVDNATGVDTDVVFDFNTTLSQANLGAAFTVVQSTTDGSGTRVGTSELRFDDRDALDYFTSPNDNQSTDNNIGGAGNTYFQTTAGGVWSSYSPDPCLAFELYNSTSIPLGNDENASINSIANPFATVEKCYAVAASNLINGSDKVIFREGTYRSEYSYGGSTNAIWFGDGVGEIPGSVIAYQGERVAFETPEQKLNSIEFRNLGNVVSSYYIDGIDFRNGSASVTRGFVKFDQVSNWTTLVNIYIQNNTFTQLESENDLLDGAIRTATTGKAIYNVLNNTVTVADAKGMEMANLNGTLNIKNNTIINLAPQTSDNSEAPCIFVSGRSGVTTDTYINVENNTLKFVIGGSNSGAHMLQADYFNHYNISNNYFDLSDSNALVEDSTPPINNMRIGNSSLLTEPTHYRNLKTLRIENNTCKNINTRGSFLAFYKTPAAQTANHIDAGSIVTVKDNLIEGNPFLRRSDSNALAIDTFASYVEDFIVDGNTFKDYQDVIRPYNLGTNYVIKNNIFDQLGDDTAGSKTVSIFIRLEENVDPVVIENNTFIFGEKGTCIYFSSLASNTTDVLIKDNSFIFIGAEEKSANNNYLVYRASTDNLDQFTFKGNYYYGLENLNTTSSLTSHLTGGTLLQGLALLPETTYHTTNIVKNGPVGTMIKRMSGTSLGWNIK